MFRARPSCGLVESAGRAGKIWSGDETNWEGKVPGEYPKCHPQLRCGGGGSTRDCGCGVYKWVYQCYPQLQATKSREGPGNEATHVGLVLISIDGFQMAIKHPTAGGQARAQEADVQQIFHLERSSFFYLSGLMVRTQRST